MAATVHKRARLALILCLTLTASSALMANDAADVHAVIGAMADSLSDGEAAMAMIAFSKACPDYETLAQDFDALTQAYGMDNQLEFADETVSSTDATESLHWALTLTARRGAFTLNRNADITVKLKREHKKWRIVSFTPIAIFNPQEGQ